MEPPDAECLTTGEDEECLLTHPRRLLTGFFASSGSPPQPHPQWFSGFWRPFESPGPVPVTEDAAILNSKKMGRPCPRSTSLYMYLLGCEHERTSVFADQSDVFADQSGFFSKTFM